MCVHKANTNHPTKYLEPGTELQKKSAKCFRERSKRKGKEERQAPSPGSSTTTSLLSSADRAGFFSLGRRCHFKKEPTNGTQMRLATISAVSSARGHHWHNADPGGPLKAHQSAQNRAATSTEAHVRRGPAWEATMPGPRPRTRRQAQRPRAPRAAATSPRPPRRRRGAPGAPQLCHARPAQHRRPGPTPTAGSGDLAALAGLTSAENRGAARSFPGPSAARAWPAARAGLRPLAAAHPRRRPAAALGLSRPQPSAFGSPPPPSWVRPAALQSNNAQRHWPERPAAVQHCALLLVNLEQGVGPGKGGAGEVERGLVSVASG